MFILGEAGTGFMGTYCTLFYYLCESGTVVNVKEFALNITGSLGLIHHLLFFQVSPTSENMQWQFTLYVLLQLWMFNGYFFVLIIQLM